MKFVVQDLIVGEITTAKITEILSETEVIMSFAGDLLRVQNLSRRQLQIGELVQCKVTQLHPLRFELARSPSSRPGRATPKMDRLI
jgi:hypothetical protein